MRAFLIRVIKNLCSKDGSIRWNARKIEDNAVTLGTNLSESSGNNTEEKRLNVNLAINGNFYIKFTD